MALILANIICVRTDSMPVMVLACLVAGWFRMWATFLCNSTIQLWLTPKRDMAVFFCFVYIVVDGTIQLSGLTTIYLAFYSSWEYMHWLKISLLALMAIVVLLLLKPLRCPLYIPLLGIDWLGAILWTGFMTGFSFMCVYGNYYDWWDAPVMRVALVLTLLCVAINLWRAYFLRHPYVSFQAMTKGNVAKASVIYLLFFLLLGTEHVFEHGYAVNILEFDEINVIDLNWYVFAGIVAGVIFTYYVFALRKWRYKNMVAIAVALAVMYLAYFYFFIDYSVEKEMLFIPLSLRGMAAVIISIVLLTSIVQSGLPFMVFPQALVINGFMGAVMPAVFATAVIGEWFNHVMARNASLLGVRATGAAILPDVLGSNFDFPALYGAIQRQALLVSMKEIFGWLLIGGIFFFIGIVLSHFPMRPNAIFPTWKRIRHLLRRSSRAYL